MKYRKIYYYIFVTFIAIFYSLTQSAITTASEFELGEIELYKATPEAVVAEYFRVDLLHSLNKGETLASLISLEQKQARSQRSDMVEIGNEKKSLSFMWMLQGSDGASQVLFLSQIKVLKAINKDTLVKDGIYNIKARRNLAAGEVLAAYVVGYSDTIFALESVLGDVEGESIDIPVVIISKQTDSSLEGNELEIIHLWRQVLGGASKNK